MKSLKSFPIMTAVIGLVSVVAGYAILFVHDWRIGLGVFLVHFSINLDRKLES